MPTVGFLPPDDPRFLGTVRVIEDELVRNGLVLRYRTEAGLDGLPGDEHPFLACSFWLVTAYAMTGRLEEGHELMGQLVALANDVGLMSEEYDSVDKRMVGNFPQAFSHLALIGAAHALEDAEKALAEAGQDGEGQVPIDSGGPTDRRTGPSERRARTR
jgi:GH15 family glucan-1,4-alpha-glucosidase